MKKETIVAGIMGFAAGIISEKEAEKTRKKKAFEKEDSLFDEIEREVRKETKD
jgi:hypothetical protein